MIEERPLSASRSSSIETLDTPVSVHITSLSSFVSFALFFELFLVVVALLFKCVIYFSSFKLNSTGKKLIAWTCLKTMWQHI